MPARYDVLTWDTDAQAFTEQEGMTSPSRSVDLHGLRRALRELRTHFGYSCHRIHYGGHVYSDPAVLVKRIQSNAD